MFNYQLHHVGIIVRDIAKALEVSTALTGYKESFPREIVTTFQAEVAFLLPESRLPGLTAIELIQPLSEEGALGRFLDKRGEGLHHLCYEVKDIEQELQLLSARGFQLIDTKPRPGAHHSLVAFLHPKSCGGVLTEIRQQL